MSQKRKLPQTSIDAYHAAVPEMISAHHIKIIVALRLTKKGMMYEQIAAHTKLEKHQIGRRLSELERMKPEAIVYKTGEKRKTVSGREANVYDLTEAGLNYIIPEKHLPGKTVSDYSKAIQSVQPTLF